MPIFLTRYLLVLTEKIMKSIYIAMTSVSFLFAMLDFQFAQAQNFDIQGHRGCRGLLPENSIAAMLHAIDLGVHTLEMDVVVSGDGQIVVSHEPYLSAEICRDKDNNPINPDKEKMFNLYQMPYSDIRKCDCGSKKHPRFSEQQLQPTYKPLLADLLAQTEAYHRQKYPQQTLYYNIETKTTPRTDDLFHPQPAPFVELLMEVITKQQLESRVCIQSFDVRTLQYVHQKYPHITTALLVWKGKNVEKNLKKLGFMPTIYSPHFHLVDAAMIAYLHQKGIKVIPWTVNEVADMERLIALQVDGLISDYPNRYMAWRQEQQPPISIKILSDEKDDNSVTVQSTDTAYRAIFDSQSGYGKATIAALQADKALECIWSFDKLEGFTLSLNAEQSISFFEHEGKMEANIHADEAALWQGIALQIVRRDTTDKSADGFPKLRRKNDYVLHIPRQVLEKSPTWNLQWIDFYR